MSPKEYWIWLQMSLGQGSSKIDDILLKFGDPQSFYKAGEEGFQGVKTLTMTEIGKLKRFDEKAIEKTLSDCNRIGCRIITPDDPAFPKRLQNIYGMPAVLYVLGEIGEIDRTLAIAMVGTRKPDLYGINAAKRIGYDLATEGVLLVSGCAEGIDAICHQAALVASMPTIAFLGCGLDIDYPKSNHDLKEKILERGALISEYPPGTKAFGRNFPARNRLIAGITLGTVVVQAPAKSGSLITADFALEQGKDVFVVPGSIFSSLSKGNMHLLKQGAIPIDSAMDILAQYRGYLSRVASHVDGKAKEEKKTGRLMEKEPVFHRKPKEELVIKRADQHTINIETSPVSKEAKMVWKALSEEPMAIDEIFSRVDMMMGNMLAALTELEIQGLCRSYPGGRFSRIFR